MPNTLKAAGGSDNLALQVTRPVRQANLVEEQPPEEQDEQTRPPYATDRAEVRIHAFDGLILVVDRNRMSNAATAELVRHAITETQTVFRAIHGTVIIQGQGYMFQLPNAAEAGFEKGEPAPVQTAPNLLVIHKQSDEATQLAQELVAMRHEQVTT